MTSIVYDLAKTPDVRYQKISELNKILETLSIRR